VDLRDRREERCPGRCDDLIALLEGVSFPEAEEERREKVSETHGKKK